MAFETLEPPYLLLAAPVLLDPNFQKTVVLMGHHSTEGAVGWVVNRAVVGGAGALLPDEVASTLHPETPLRIGGPVATPGLIVIHREKVAGIESLKMADGLYVSATPDVLPRLFSEPPAEEPVSGLLVFGYAGWGPGQLEHEMEDGAWLVLPYDPVLAFPSRLVDAWERALFRLGVNPLTVTAQPGGVN